MMPSFSKKRSGHRIFLLLCLIPVFLLHGRPLQSQDYSWWNEIHDWDGVTHWVRYLTISPAYFGPNAMPVPDITAGILPEKGRFELSAEGHFGNGDRTGNLYTEFYFPLFSDLAGLNIRYVPVEYYKMDTAVRDLRKARDYDGEGFAAGDFYIGTFIQIIKDKPGLPDLLISANIKTASGTNLEGARFNDVPGYYFDATLSKSFALNKAGSVSIRPFFMGGFYAWQTYRTDFPQNDAYMYGAGFELDSERISMVSSVGGYSGWMKIGDKPVVFRFDMETRLDSRVNLKLRFQQGIRDYPFSSVRVGMIWDIDPMLKKIRSLTLPKS